MKLSRSLMLATACAPLLMHGTPASAASSYVIGTVTSVLMNADSTFGGCMAGLSVSPASKLSNCAPDYVTFSCSGDYTDQVRAYRLLDQAQLAFATNATVVVAFQDDKVHNGYCFAYRIDVVR